MEIEKIRKLQKLKVEGDEKKPGGKFMEYIEDEILSDLDYKSRVVT